MSQTLRQFIPAPLPDYPEAIGTALWALQDTRRRTMRTLERVKPDMLDVKVEGMPHAIGTVLYHIAAIELDWLYGDVLQSAWHQDLASLFPHPVRNEFGELTPVTGDPFELHQQRLNVVREKLLHGYRGLTLEEFRRIRMMEGYVVTPEWVLHHLCQHEAEHRDEIGWLVTHLEARSGY